MASTAPIATPDASDSPRQSSSRSIPADQLELLAAWMDALPTVPQGRWFKRFPGMTICGEGDLVKTFLTVDQSPTGEELV